MPKISFLYKLLITVVGLLLIFGTTATLIVYLQTRNILFEHQIENHTFITDSSAIELELIFNQSKRLVHSVALDPDVINNLENNLEPNEEIVNKLNLYNIENRYLAVYILDTDGNVVASTDPDFYADNVNFRHYFQIALNQEEYIEMALGTSQGEPGYYYSHIIRSERGKTLGVAVMKMSQSKIDTRMQQINNSPYNKYKAKFYLVNKFGIIINSPREDFLYKSLGDLTLTAQQELKDSKQFLDHKIEPLEYQQVQNALYRINNIENFEIYDPYDHEPEVVFIQKVPDSDFYVFSEFDKSPAIAEANTIALTQSGFVVLATLAVTVCVIYLVNRLLLPLEEIKEMVVDVAKGRLQNVEVLKTGDEFEELSVALSQTSNKLQESLQEVEKQVQEKTKRLTKINNFLVDRELEMKELKEENKELKEQIKSMSK